MDAISYVRLGGVFTANMTGNTVLLGIALAQGHGQALLRSAVALGGFCAGATLGATWTGGRAGFAAEAALLALLAVFGGLVGGRIGPIAVSGGTMGLQAATVRRHNATGVNVTFITGTVTTLVMRGVDRLRGRRSDREGDDEGPSLPAAVWITYAIGGVAGAAAAQGWHTAAFALPAVAAAAAAIRPWTVSAR